MTAEIVLQQTPDAAAVHLLREQLAGARAALAGREAGLARLRAQLKAFESRYLQRVGILYVELDEIEARLAEREVDLYDSDSARRRAQQARQRAQETHAAAFEHAHEPAEFDPPPVLKTLFREVARRIHPDFARDEAERQHFTLLMARANQAYGRGDTGTLERMLDDQRELLASTSAEDAAAELKRMTRQIRHAERDLTALGVEEQSLIASEIGQLSRDVEAAASEGRDLLAELSATLREQIVDAQQRFARIDRQIAAHGR